MPSRTLSRRTSLLSALAWLALGVLLCVPPAAAQAVETAAEEPVAPDAAVVPDETDRSNETVTSGETSTVAVDAWLVLGPVDWPLPGVAPGFGDYGLDDLLTERKIDVETFWPRPGDLYVAGAASAAWAPRSGSLSLAGSDLPRVAWAASYLESERFADVQLAIDASYPLRVFLDGEEVASRKEPGAADAGSGAEADAGSGAEADAGAEPLEVELALVPGKHLLVVETVRGPSADAKGASAWTLAAELRDVPSWAGLAASRSPRHGLRLADLLDVDDAGSLDLSPDGRHLAVHWRHPAVPAEHRESWSEIFAVETGRRVHRVRPDAAGFAWSPDSESYAVATPSPGGEDGEKTHDLWLAPLPVDSGDVAPRRLLAGIEGWSGHRFLPDGTGLILATTEKAEPDPRDVKRYRVPTDRWSGWRDRTHVWHVPVEGGTKRRLTVGGNEDRVVDVATGRVLLIREHYGLSERPFQRIEVLEIDLDTLDLTTVADEGWLTDARYLDPASITDRRVVVTGSPTSFDDAGRDPDLAAERLPNLYETEAFLLDPGSGSSGAVDAFTRDWDPTVNALATGGGSVWLVGQEESWSRIFRHDVGSGGFEQLDSGVDTVAELDVSRDGTVLAYRGSSVSDPEAVWVRSAASAAAPRRLVRGGEDSWAQVDLGRVETWTFRMPGEGESAGGSQGKGGGEGGGEEILGRVYYPPDFDPGASYPLIVSFYGGTVPTERSFGGRYPRHHWTAHGYVVYVPQPSGATGFGQEFSARHVNAWGRRTADEILEGTRQFLAAHPFVDRDRVGCIGASYGGFMTMYLLSRSDLFAAGISHAGISNLGSYWGKGWWGYLYSAAATAGSYPWNAQEIYVGQSPLFQADRIETPLLLLHGDADVNVPPVESHQMYTALEVLGRDVELITIGGEDHHILDYPKRKLWMQTILAYFASKLQDRPEWWEHLWGTDSSPKG